jgi:divalent metal cation (Fe/Co/Zn/Cd) transporter
MQTMKLKHALILLGTIVVLGLIGTVAMEVAGSKIDPVTGEHPEWVRKVAIGGKLFSIIVTICCFIYAGRQGLKKAKQEAQDRDLCKIRHDL